MEPGRSELLEQERRFNEQLAQLGPFRAYVALLDPFARLHRQARTPLVEPDSIKAYLSSLARQTSEPLFGDISEAGDLGYTYGRYAIMLKHANLSEEGYYARVWRRDEASEWRILIDVSNPLKTQ